MKYPVSKSRPIPCRIIETPGHHHEPCSEEPTTKYRNFRNAPDITSPVMLCVYLVEEEYLVTALVPSDTACLANSPGRISRTEVWISRDEMVDFLL